MSENQKAAYERLIAKYGKKTAEDFLNHYLAVERHRLAYSRLKSKLGDGVARQMCQNLLNSEYSNLHNLQNA